MVDLEISKDQLKQEWNYFDNKVAETLYQSLKKYVKNGSKTTNNCTKNHPKIGLKHLPSDSGKVHVQAMI